jgi:hypothetical protein
MYLPDKNTNNKVEDLKKKLQRARSIMSEIEQDIIEIRSDKDKYIRPHEYVKTGSKYDEFWKKCKDSDEERRKTYNMENAEHLVKKCKSEFEKMENVLFHAAWYDVNQDPITKEDTKCSHDKCKRERVKDSKYCDECIQLPTKECNFCKTE